MRQYLINPSNPLVSIVNVNESRWNRYRVWKPLSLMVLVGLTPPGWEIIIVDENLGRPDYSAMPRPDLVGITAFTSQASRAYEVAAHFRHLGVPVVMGGIRATLCLDEVMEHVDSVVTGERGKRRRPYSSGTTPRWRRPFGGMGAAISRNSCWTLLRLRQPAGYRLGRWLFSNNSAVAWMIS